MAKGGLQRSWPRRVVTEETHVAELRQKQCIKEEIERQDGGMRGKRLERKRFVEPKSVVRQGAFVDA